MYRRPFPRSEATGVAKQSPGLPAPPSPPFTYDYFVSPTGSPSNDGLTPLTPWNLAYPLAGADGLIVPGVHIALLGGQYLDSIAKRPTVAGTDLAWIVWRNYNGQWVEWINDSPLRGSSQVATVEVGVPYNQFWGIDAWRKHTDRFNYPGPGTNWYILNAAKGKTRITHCWGHEGSNGLFTDSDYGQLDVYGSYFMHAGVSTDPRAHGFYVHHTRNSDFVGSRAVLEECMSFDHLGNCGQVFASGSPEQMDDIDLLGLVAWGGGRIAAVTGQVNLTIGGTDSANIPLRGFTAKHVISRNPVGYGRANLRFYDGGAGVNQDAIVEDCYLVGGTPGSGNGRLALGIMSWTDFQARRNTMINLEQTQIINIDESSFGPFSVWEDNAFYGSDPTSTRWRTGPGFTDRTWAAFKAFTGLGTTSGHEDTAQTGLPAVARIFVRPTNLWEYGRGHVVVFNWASLPRVPVDLGAFLAVGDTFVVRNIQQSSPERNPDLHVSVYDAPTGGNVVTTWTGSPVYFPMNGVTPATPYGFNNSGLDAWLNPAPTSAPDFDAFVVAPS